jgi:hypothetical protein
MRHIHVKVRREKMIEKGLFLTGSDAELLDRALSEVKTKAYEESEAQLDDTQALDTLVSYFRNALKDSHEKEKRQSYFTPLRRCVINYARKGSFKLPMLEYPLLSQ